MSLEKNPLNPPVFGAVKRADPALDLRHRRIVGPDGREWRVREAPMPAFDRRAGTCLIFDTIDAARRVRHYPADWFERSDEELYQLTEMMARET